MFWFANDHSRAEAPRTFLRNFRLYVEIWALLLSGCTFLSRSFTYFQIDPILDSSWYQPTERVRGGLARPLRQASRPTVPQKALQAAVRYARRSLACALLVVHRDALVLERYWCGCHRNTPLQTMSLSKTVVGLLVGIALKEGTLHSLDSPVARYLSEWAGDNRSAITVRHLLQMTSGLGQGPLVRIHLGSQVAQRTLAVPLVETPGRRFEYNNMNTQVLSLLLERRSGKRYAAYLSSRLWRPLGARDAQVWLDRPRGTAKTYCCLLATAQDWARVGLLLQHHGRVAGRQVVPRVWIKKMLTPSESEPGYGLHVWLGSTRPRHRRPTGKRFYLAKDTVILMGQQEQRVYVIPSRELVIVRLGRAAGPTWEDTTLPNLLVQALRTPSSKKGDSP